jgi:hypothetical protein
MFLLQLTFNGTHDIISQRTELFSSNYFIEFWRILATNHWRSMPAMITGFLTCYIEFSEFCKLWKLKEFVGGEATKSDAVVTESTSVTYKMFPEDTDGISVKQ